MVTCPADQDGSTQYTGTINDNDDEEEVEEEDGEIIVMLIL